MGYFDWLTGNNVPTQYGDQAYIQGQVKQGIRNAQGQIAPQVDNDAQLRNAQLDQINQLTQIASGQRQGAGELAAERQTQNAAAQQQAMARMARGGANPALAFRNAASNTAGVGLAGAGMAQQAALQDQANAQGLLSSALQGTRGQDIGVSGQNAQLRQNQFGMNNQAALGYLGQLGNMDANQLNAGALAAQYQDNGMRGLVGSGLSGAASGLVLSDENAKTEIEPAGDEIDFMLDKLHSYNYRYKDERNGKGKRAGIMAQDMERSKLGKQIVRDTPAGKGLDVDKTISTLLASVARLNERVRKTEGKGKKAA